MKGPAPRYRPGRSTERTLGKLQALDLDGYGSAVLGLGSDRRGRRGSPCRETRFLPARLAAYKASSAARISSSAAGATSSGSDAIPKLAVIRRPARKSVV